MKVSTSGTVLCSPSYAVMAPLVQAMYSCPELGSHAVEPGEGETSMYASTCLFKVAWSDDIKIFQN